MAKKTKADRAVPTQGVDSRNVITGPQDGPDSETIMARQMENTAAVGRDPVPRITFLNLYEIQALAEANSRRYQTSRDSLSARRAPAG